MSASLLVRSAFVGRLGAGIGECGLHGDACRALGEDHRMGVRQIGGERFGGSGHPRMVCKPDRHPTEVGRQVAWG
jgi:hypothetical protein